MTITIALSPETERELLARAATTGKDISTLVEEALAARFREPLRTYDQVLEPFRRGFEESGLSDEEVDQLFEESLAEVRAEKRKKQP